MKGRPRVSCLTINYNTVATTAAFLESLHRETQELSVEVIVVDNGSTDSSVEVLRHRFPRFDIVDAGENLGFAKGVNLAAGRSTGRYLLLLNPDMVVLPGALSALLDFADTNPQYGIYGGRTVRADGALEPSSCWAAPTLWSLLMFASTLSTVFRRSAFFNPESMGRWKRDSVREVDLVSGCLLLIRRELFFELGAMDEDFFLYGEDAEFCLRAASLGHRLVIVPTAQMIHEVGGSTDSKGNKTCMVLAGKVTMLRKIWGPVRSAIGLRLLLIGVGIRALGENLLGRPRHWAMAWRRRASWWPGYPAARQSIFGLPVGSMEGETR